MRGEGWWRGGEGFWVGSVVFGGGHSAERGGKCEAEQSGGRKDETDDEERK